MLIFGIAQFIENNNNKNNISVKFFFDSEWIYREAENSGHTELDLN